MSSHLPSRRFPHQRTLWSCRCTPPHRCTRLGCRRHPCSSNRRPAGRRGGHREGGGKDLRRAWERIGEEERRLQEREARAMGEAAGAAEGRTREQGTAGGGEAQAVEELQRAWADLRRRLERVERAEQDASGPGNGLRRAGGRRVAPRCSRSGSRLFRRSRRGRCTRGPGGGSGARQRGWRRGTGRWRSRSAG